MSIKDLPPLREVIAEYDLRAKKSFGQNFLLDLNLTGKIARLAGDLSDSVVYEVGPGPGGLTRAILGAEAKHLVAVEMDHRCIAALEDIKAASGNRLTVIEADANTVDELSELNRIEADASKRIIANLPYNVGTLLFVKWLTVQDWLPWYTSLTLMFQREVAERIVAVPGSKAYGRLSVLAQWRGKARIALNVPAAAFTPPPKVDSAIILFEPTEPLDDTVMQPVLEKIVEKAFGQRRKMLRASLKGIGVDPIELLELAGIKETERAENVTVKEFVDLAKCYQKLASV